MRKVFLPDTLEALWDLWNTYPQAALMAGGTDFLVGLRSGKADDTVIIGLERIQELQNIHLQADQVMIGAMVAHQQLIDHAIIKNDLGILSQAASVVGSPGIRHMGTIGGNICTASPAGDTLPPLYILEARLEFISPTGTRTVPIQEFIFAPGKTDRRPMELLYRIIIPVSEPGSIGGYYKVGQRQAMAISITSMAALLWLNPDDTIAEGRFAWGSVGPTVMRFPDLEAEMKGKNFSEGLLRDIGAKAAGKIAPITDLRASAEYRRQLAANLPLRLWRS